MKPPDVNDCGKEMQSDCNDRIDANIANMERQISELQSKLYISSISDGADDSNIITIGTSNTDDGGRTYIAGGSCLASLKRKQLEYHEIDPQIVWGNVYSNCKMKVEK